MWTTLTLLTLGLAIRSLAAVSASAAEQRYAYNTKGKRDSSKLNVHIVCHTHDDAGWLKTVDQYYYGARQDIQTAGVQFILTSVIQALRDNPDRKFVYGEMAFFTRWWAYQNDETREFVQQLVGEGRLDFVNGGYVQHDEAAAHYVAMIDQTTRGHRFLNETFGKRVRIGWQVDPFGHSATQASLMSAVVGFDALFFGRADYQDMDLRRAERRMEMVWRASQSWGASADIYTHNNYDGNYSPPPGGFMFEWGSRDPPIIDDPESPDYNVKERVEWFVQQALAHGHMTRGNDVIFLEGTDFTYANANPWFISLDRLIHYVNLDGRVNAFYSTPAAFIDAKRSYPPANVQWPLKTDDFFPYADCPDCFWTGYFTSRAASKRYIRASTSFLQVARQLEVLSQQCSAGAIDALEAAVSLTQHHDSITGTEKQHVANDYHRRLHKGWVQAAEFTGRALLALLFPKANPQPPPPTSTATIAKTSRRLAASSDPRQPHSLHPHTNPRDPTTTPHADADAAADPPAITLTQCYYLNASICDVTVKATGRGQGVMVVVYNPLAWPRTHYVRVPLGSGPYIYHLEDADGAAVPSQLLPEFSSTKALQQALLTTGEVPDLAAVAAQSIAFAATLPPLGYKTFFIRATAAPSPPPSPDHPADAPNPAGPVTISNSELTLTFNGTSGRLVSAEATDGTWKLPLQHGLLWYRGNDGVNDPLHPGLGSGTYIFRVAPNSPDPNEITWDDVGGVKLRVVKGPVVQEVHQAFGTWAHVTTRLWEGQAYAEVEWTVGPIPVADRVSREVVTRYTTGLATDGILYTDSNGREMLQRRRDYRPSWNLTVTAPVAGNFYPITSAAAITDGEVALTVITERAQGAASLADGQLEVMVHRRCVGEDQRGVGENLNETQCYCRNCPCMGLIVRGTHLLSIQPAASAPAVARHLQVAHNDPPLLSFAALPTPTTAASSLPNAGDDKRQTGGSSQRDAAGADGTGRSDGGELRGAAAFGLKGLRGMWSGAWRGEGLPENVHLVTLMGLDHRRVLVRLAHNLQAGEHPTLAAPVRVDLTRVLGGAVQVVSVQELSLAAGQYKAQMGQPHKWPLEAGAADPAAASGAPQYDIGSHNDTMPVVELFPMEIRAFEIVTAA